MASAKRNAKIELTSSAAGMDKGVNDARRKLRAFQREQQKAARDKERADKKAAKDREKGLSRMSSAGHAVATGLAAAAGFDIAGGLGGLVKDVFDTEREMTRFQIDAQLGADKMAEFRAATMKTSEATGVSRNELTKAAHTYQILTGDAEGAIKTQEVFAKVANASGASMEDIASSAAAMKQNLDIDPADFQKGFDVLLNMGHKGSVELRDFAQEMSGLAPQFKNFGSGSSVEKLTEMSAAAQGIRKNFGSAAEMATGFRAIMNQLSKSKTANAFAKHGVDIWTIDPKTKQHIRKDFFEIVADIKKKIPDQKVLQDILGGRQESSRALQAMVEHWDEIVALKNEAANSDQVNKDNATYMESSTGRIAMAWEHVKNSLAEAFTPARIDMFASALAKAADYFGQIVAFASNLMDMWNQLHGGTKETRNIAKAEMFIDPISSGEQTEAQVIAHARKILAYKDSSSNLAKDMDLDDYKKLGSFSSGDSHSGLVEMKKAAREALDSIGPQGADMKGAKYSDGHWTRGTNEFYDGSSGRWNKDTWKDSGVRHYGPANTKMDPDALGKAVAEALRRTPLKVIIDGAGVLRALDNSSIMRLGSRSG